MTVPQVFQVDVEKFLNGEFWSNRYYTSAGSLAIAAQDAPGFATAERLFHAGPVTFTKVRVSTIAPGDNQFVIIPINLSGQFNPGDDLLPLFNTVRIDFPAGFGRPYRKYYRGVLAEGVINGSVISSSALGTAIDNAMNALVGANTDVQGDPLGEGVLQTRIQMRQLRRGTRRRTQPILP